MLQVLIVSLMFLEENSCLYDVKSRRHLRFRPQSKQTLVSGSVQTTGKMKVTSNMQMCLRPLRKEQMQQNQRNKEGVSAVNGMRSRVPFPPFRLFVFVCRHPRRSDKSPPGVEWQQPHDELTGRRLRQTTQLVAPLTKADHSASSWPADRTSPHLSHPSLPSPSSQTSPLFVFPFFASIRSFEVWDENI